ncbi:hypothetical protein FOL47_006358 [Perkinsus chesapeaki]|uniref:Uncharacterized protein n=1 Tax=Perkinsus chesapeaki TaxID=330153 RepID=A0A7J6LTT7_PERCH|nr:hypothetical protein FOL47_006358 [Perkinsus chesapeaki]
MHLAIPVFAVALTIAESALSSAQHTLDDEYKALLDSLDGIRTEPDDIAKRFGIDVPPPSALRGPAASALVEHSRKKSSSLLDEVSLESRAEEAEMNKDAGILADVEKHLDSNIASLDKDLK